MRCRWKFAHSGIMSDFAWNWFRAGQRDTRNRVPCRAPSMEGEDVGERRGRGQEGEGRRGWGREE